MKMYEDVANNTVISIVEVDGVEYGYANSKGVVDMLIIVDPIGLGKSIQECVEDSIKEQDGLSWEVNTPIVDKQPDSPYNGKIVNQLIEEGAIVEKIV